MRADGVEEPLLAVRRAGRALLVAQEHHVALAHGLRRERLARGLAGRHVVGGDEAHVVAAGEVRVEDDDGHARVGRGLHGADEPLVAERREDDAADALRDEGLHDVDLVLEVVLAQRPLPDHLDAELARRLHRPRVHALPELVRRALRHHRDAQTSRAARQSPPPRLHETQTRESKQKDQKIRRRPPPSPSVFRSFCSFIS